MLTSPMSCEKGRYGALFGFWHFCFGLSEVECHSQTVPSTFTKRVQQFRNGTATALLKDIKENTVCKQ